ncbi:MAG: M28 family peptidase [Candidatus Koribacter versatilis]|uniref:M28 family peptidase n=1 Tax=Candidatus Korobacter versatilis TaxID=658062 RepID=A0A932ENM5_9BACT|nr:M28 family peptidase [Candidatus Koribacter versatilis]
MRKLGIILVVLLCLVSLGAAPGQTSSAPQARLAGYSIAASAKQREWEEKFRALPEPANLRAYMQRLTAQPHHVGSPYDKDNAEWMLARFKEWGWDAHIETFDVLFPTPKERLLELVAPTKFVAKLQEAPVAGDTTSGQQALQLPTYNAYSGDGDVTAPLIYVNFGLREDYETLDRMGISVKGAIVIARYGHAWRGIKPKVAYEHGAIGCILYSDPQQDGYNVGDVFPKGGLRPSQGVQRGAVTDTQYPGDPLTPGIGSVPGAKRIALKGAPTIVKIPVLPISYADAQPLLAAITGRVAPKEWRGALPITYHIGPGAAKVHLKALFNWDTKPLYDVIAKLPGSEYPDEWILRGNHHDAWVNGADDPISGQVALLEEARALGELYKQGWRPKRTILYAAWDGEEPGLLGSTEWVETHAEELRQHAVVYINSDSNGRGFIYIGGSHSLENFANAIEKDIQDPEKKISVWKRDQMWRIDDAKSADDRKEIRNREDLRIEALGDGSDYSPFLDHLGVSSLAIEYGGEDDAGVYHSIYDDFYWFTHYSDTDFAYGRALSQTIGTAVMRLADSEVLPYEFTNFADTVKKYVDELQKLLKDKQEEAEERNKRLEEGVYTAMSDPKNPTLPPPTLERPPFLNFAPLQNGLETLTASAERYRKAMQKAEKNGDLVLSPDVARELNAKLILTERALIVPEGLPGRAWYKHQIYTPGVYTGYGVKTLAAIREPLEERKYKQAEAAIPRVAQTLRDSAAAIDAASAILEKAAQ